MALIYRAHFAFTKIRINSKGPTQELLLALPIAFMKLLKRESQRTGAVAFDMSAPTFRHEQYPEYKANREETPEDIKIGTPIVKDIVRAFNIPVLELPGYEADDIIGTFAKKRQKKDFKYS